MGHRLAIFWWLLGNSILVRGGGIAGMHQRCLPEELPDNSADHRQRCRSHATQFFRCSIARPCHLQAHRGGQKAARDSAAPEMRSCRSQKKKQAHFVQLFFGRSPLLSLVFHFASGLASVIWIQVYLCAHEVALVVGISCFFTSWEFGAMSVRHDHLSQKPSKSTAPPNVEKS